MFKNRNHNIGRLILTNPFNLSKVEINRTDFTCIDGIRSVKIGIFLSVRFIMVYLIFHGHRRT